jgi:hypothetical protein
MSLITQDLKDYFCRHFLGKVNVSCLPLAVESPQIFSLKRLVETHPIRTQTRAVGSTLFVAGKIACSSRGVRFSAQMVRVNGSKIRKYASGELKAHPVSKLKTTVRENTKRASVVPQERTNRLQWQTARPKRNGEMILAWFGPIVDEAVVKLTLNKRQGTLFIWYNPQSRHFNSKGLYLYRRLGANENLEWRWV